jgi:spore coat protein U-like protein
MTRWLVVVAVAAGAVLGCSTAAHADSCSIDTTSVVFGSYNVFSTAPVDSTGSIEYRCVGNARNVRISISDGLGNSYSQRRMWRIGDTLGYNLFLDAARTIIWGDGSGQTETYFNSRPPNNRDISVPVYARIPEGQDVSAGVYIDLVTVTVDF